MTVVSRSGAGVGRDHNGRIRFPDAIGDRSGRDVLVVGTTREGPVIAGIRAGVGVGRMVHTNRADNVATLTVHACDGRHSRGVRIPVIGRSEACVGRDHYGRVHFIDDEVACRQARQGVVVISVGRHEIRRYGVGAGGSLGSGATGQNIERQRNQQHTSDKQ